MWQRAFEKQKSCNPWITTVNRAWVQHLGKEQVLKASVYRLALVASKVWTMKHKFKPQWWNSLTSAKAGHCYLVVEGAEAVASRHASQPKTAFTQTANASVLAGAVGSLRIAVVDDQAAMRIALRRLLSAHGHRVEVFSSAEEFLSVALNTEAHCLLLDFHLPQMSGLDLAHQLTELGYGPPIIFMSGSEDEDIRRECLDFGCVAFLRKPFSQSELTAALAAAAQAAAILA
jgi:CheY-like chemotaxis protein